MRVYIFGLTLLKVFQVSGGGVGHYRTRPGHCTPHCSWIMNPLIASVEPEDGVLGNIDGGCIKIGCKNVSITLLL